MSEGGTLIPDSFAEAFRAEQQAFHREFAAMLDREFVLGDGTPAPPVPQAPLRARVRYWAWRSRAEVETRYRRLRWRLVDGPRERLGKRIAPWLMNDEEAEERYGDW